jgi:hypothetical protein
MTDRTNELRNEARRLTPAFSPALHARVMAAVRAQAAPVGRSPHQPWRYTLAAAALVAIAAGAWVLTRPAVVPPPKQPIARDFRIASPLPPVELTLATDAGNPAYAYLDHDMKAFGRYVARQLDVVPNSRR